MYLWLHLHITVQIDAPCYTGRYSVIENLKRSLCIGFEWPIAQARSHSDIKPFRNIATLKNRPYCFQVSPKCRHPFFCVDWIFPLDITRLVVIIVPVTRHTNGVHSLITRHTNSQQGTLACHIVTRRRSVYFFVIRHTSFNLTVQCGHTNS